VQAACEEARAYAAERSREALHALDQLPNNRARELLRALSLVLTRRKA
jgi:hypothetical protein